MLNGRHDDAKQDQIGLVDLFIRSWNGTHYQDYIVTSGSFCWIPTVFT